MSDTYDLLFLADKHTIANTKILDIVWAAVQVELNLEVAATMLLSCLLIFVGDHKVIDNSFLQWRVLLTTIGNNLTIVVIFPSILWHILYFNFREIPVHDMKPTLM